MEIFQDSYVCRDLTIKSKFLKEIFFYVLLIHNIKHTAEKSSKTDSKGPMNQVDRGDPQQVIAFEVHKNVKKC